MTEKEADKRCVQCLISRRELAMILGALRDTQREGWSAEVEDIVTEGGEIYPLSDDEIDDLCERLNGGG